jgi:hypothetical protein
MKAYVIHMSSAREREALVQDIERLTGAQRFEAIRELPGEVGCHKSHMAIYHSVPAGEDLLLFEDDCEILDPSFMTMVQEQKKHHDIVYIGLNYIFFDSQNRMNSYGAHAMWISPYAISCILNHTTDTIPIDKLWNEVEHAYHLRVWRPNPLTMYVRQKPGLRSYITGMQYIPTTFSWLRSKK